MKFALILESALTFRGESAFCAVGALLYDPPTESVVLDCVLPMLWRVREFEPPALSCKNSL